LAIERTAGLDGGTVGALAFTAAAADDDAGGAFGEGFEVNFVLFVFEAGDGLGTGFGDKEDDFRGKDANKENPLGCAEAATEERTLAADP
jgi:hypothetical protein